jgi:hypothetical protein
MFLYLLFCYFEAQGQGVAERELVLFVPLDDLLGFALGSVLLRGELLDLVVPSDFDLGLL